MLLTYALWFVSWCLSGELLLVLICKSTSANSFEPLEHILQLNTQILLVYFLKLFAYKSTNTFVN